MVENQKNNVTEQGVIIEPLILKPRKSSLGKVTPAGTKFMIRAKLSIDKETGNQIAEPGEKVDLDAMIQSYEASCDISTIIKRYEAGDESVLNVNTGYFGDATILPHDINDVVNNQGLFDKAMKSFNELPDDIRALFDNDYSKFFNSVLDNKVEQIILNYQNGKTKEDVAEPTIPTEGGNN